MPMKPEVRRELLDATRSTAVAFIEDMAYFRELLNAKEITAAAIRRSSGELRRLMIDCEGDLEKIAAPRIGRIHILGPYNSPYYRIGECHPFTFFASGGVTIFNATFRGTILNQGGRPAPDMSKHHPERTEQLTMDTFLSQRVLCLNGRWATRRLLVKYVAHIAHGVHSGTAQDEHEKLIERIRRVATYGVPPAAAYISMRLDALNETKELLFKYDPKGIDVALVELLAAIKFLVSSPKLMELENIVLAELAQLS